MAKHAPRGPLKAKEAIDPLDLKHPMGAEKCTATNRQGNRCGRYPIPGGTVCRNHGGAAPQVQKKAAERLAALLPRAVERLGLLMERDEYPSVQFQASKAVIEFAEGKATERVEQQVDATLEIRWQS